MWRYKQEKEKEVNHLKAMERKRMVEISKLQEGSHKQEAVLRRKNDEITRIQRQLRETLEKQKIVAEKRQQTFERKDSSTTADKLRVIEDFLFLIIGFKIKKFLIRVFFLSLKSNGSPKSSSWAWTSRRPG